MIEYPSIYIHTYIYLSHLAVYLKVIQHGKPTIFQLKKMV